MADLSAGLRSAKIRGLLLLLLLLLLLNAAAASTTVLAFLRLVINRTGMICIFLTVYLTCTRVAHGLLYCHVCAVFIVVPCKSVWPGFLSGLGWMILLCQKNAYGFIRHAFRGTLHPVRTTSYCLVRLFCKKTDIRSEYRHSSERRERGFRARSGKFFCLFRTRGSKKANPQARFAGSTRGSVKNNPQVMVARE